MSDSELKVSAPGLEIFPPESVCGITVLDYDLFTKNVNLPFIVTSFENLQSVSKMLKPYFLKMTNLKPVQKYENDEDKFRIILNPDLLKDDAVSNIKDLSSRNFLINLPNGKYMDYDNVDLTYENFNYQMILRAILPPEVVISSYSMIGHIIHLNLRENALPFKNVIGQVW